MADDTTLDEVLKGPLPGEEGVATQPSTPPRLLENAPEQMAAATGTAGAQVGGPFPPGRMVGAAAGGAGGYFAGATARDLANEGVQALTFDHLAKNLVEAGKMGLIQGTAEGVVPVLGAPAAALAKKGVAKVMGKILLPDRPSQMVKTADEMVKGAGGPGLTAGQMFDDPAEKHLATLAENVSYNAMTSKVVNETRQYNVQAMQDFADNWAAQLDKMPTSDVGRLLVRTIDQRFDQFINRPLDAVYTSLREQMPHPIVDTRQIMKDFATNTTKPVQMLKNKVFTKREGLPDDADPMTALLTTRQAGEGGGYAINRIPIDDAMRLKTAFSRVGNKNYQDPEGQDMAAAGRYYAAALDKQIRSALANTPETLALYDKANAFASQGYNVFRDQLVKQVVHTLDKTPGKVTNVLLQPDNQDVILAVKKAVGNEWQASIEPKLAASLFYRAKNAMDNTVRGTTLAAEINKLGKDTLDATFSPGMYDKVMDLARTIDHVGHPPKGAGGVLIQLSQAGAVGAVVAGGSTYLATGDVEKSITGGAAGGATIVLLTPWALGHMVANSKFVDAMKTGLIQSAKEGKPSSLLTTTLRQLAAVGMSAGQVDRPPLQPEPEAPLPMRESALPRPARPILQAERKP